MLLPIVLLIVGVALIVLGSYYVSLNKNCTDDDCKKNNSNIAAISFAIGGLLTGASLLMFYGVFQRNRAQQNIREEFYFF